MSRDPDPRCRILAIDPGVNGAYAFLGYNLKILDTNELPRFGKSVNGVALAALLHSMRPEQVVIERVSSMPGQGVSSTFTFGFAYGVAVGVACAFGAPLAYVAPGKWKAHFRLTGKDKDASRELAIRLYPEAAQSLALKKHHGRADAILLARYALDMDAGSQFV